MNTRDIRNRFLSYFKEKGHTLVPSDSLVPSGDPTLLFTSAGMVQFKKHFLGQSKDTFTRATSAQKCFRTSDIDQIGMTNRHLTFFEMLGNFSFGDYFKSDAIQWSWEFLTKEMGLPGEKLYPTVYTDDDEAYELWKTIVPENRIVRLGADSNFWNMGPTGPCGPCSEILMDMGEDVGCKKPACTPGCSCDRYLEIWNLVFTQFDRQENGDLKPLPRKNIDTGMGLERLAAAVQGKKSIFETDLFEPLLKKFNEITAGGIIGHESKKKMIIDHARGVTFLISDGILPSNEGRGYVLRRLLRRAVRQGKLIGVNKPFLYKIVAEVCEVMKEAYPDLAQRRENISAITMMEEENFLQTMGTGMQLLNEVMRKFRSSKIIPGAEVFKLYDTFGFPHELTKEIAKENGLTIDEQGFLEAQKMAQEKSRAAWSGSGEVDITLYAKILKEIGKTDFIGYEKNILTARVHAIVKDKTTTDALAQGDDGEIILNETPFYAESGGQIGDTGFLRAPDTHIEVRDTQKPIEGIIVHKVKVLKGHVSKGQVIEAAVDMDRRKNIMAHHTATHLLHKALREVLGTHVTQAGSLVTQEYLRFDFTHFQALKQEELLAVEEIVNAAIRKNMTVCIEPMQIAEAREKGAMALFGEKYGNTVRTVSVIDPMEKKHFSMELCGGTHAVRTGDIGLFKVISESSIASGTRRIEAVVGPAAEKYIRDLQRIINDAAFKLKSTPSDLAERIDKTLAQQKELEKEIKRLKSKLAMGGDGADLSKQITEIKGIKILATTVSDVDMQSMRELADTMRAKLGSGIIVLATADNDKYSFIVNITKDLVTAGYHAGTLAKKIAVLTGGSGGGRPEFAQGGGKDFSTFGTVFKNIANIITQ